MTLPENWPIAITCEGLSCGKCNHPIVRKMRRRRLNLPLDAIVAVLEDHVPKCSDTLARAALDARMEARRRGSP